MERRRHRRRDELGCDNFCNGANDQRETLCQSRLCVVQQCSVDSNSGARGTTQQYYGNFFSVLSLFYSVENSIQYSQGVERELEKEENEEERPFLLQIAHTHTRRKSLCTNVCVCLLSLLTTVLSRVWVSITFFSEGLVLLHTFFCLSYTIYKIYVRFRRDLVSFFCFY